MTTGKARSSQLFLKQLAEFLKHCEAVATEDTEGALRALGYDPAKTATRGRVLTQRLFDERLATERAEIKMARLSAQQEAAAWSPLLKFKSEDDVDKAISEIISGKFGQPAQNTVLAFNHNYHRPTLNDKLSLLKDLGFLKTQVAKGTAAEK